MDNTTKNKRSNVILELVKSERDYLKVLQDVIEGYLKPARRQPDIFTIERINTIFSNIEQVFAFQQQFLKCLEFNIDWQEPSNSQVGQCFLDNQNGFSVYYFYCNNHTNAIEELQELNEQQKFVRFFEACRLLQNMIDIPLNGFLLTPIQKICRYPLQLNELLKYTPQIHPDYMSVESAFESMKNFANLANERKRRIDALADIMFFQEKFDNWTGPKLSETSSILIYSGEVSKLSSQKWSQYIQLHLFDHLLLYSKKDLLKRSTLILKGRIPMDTVSEIAEADESKYKRAFKLYSQEQQRWYVFATKTEEERDKWMLAFERERKLVQADEEEGFHITKKEIGVARRTLNNRKHSRSARYDRAKKPDTAVVDQLNIDEATTIMNRTLSLPSSIHPGHVMNFVQDSKVISPARVNSSVIPNNSNQNIPDQQILGQASVVSGGGWFKKVGSRRLANLKQAEENESQNTPIETTYDQLQRRHESIMMCAERARLYRLNNNLPPLDARLLTANNKLEKQEYNNPPIAVRRTSKSHLDVTSQFKSLNLDSDKDASLTDRKDSSLEATVVLSSGRVVRVRENAV